VTPEVAYRLTLHVFDEGEVGRLIEVELVIFEKAPSGVGPLQVQPMPVDHRTAAQNKAQRFHIVQREILDALQPRWVTGALS